MGAVTWAETGADGRSAPRNEGIADAAAPVAAGANIDPIPSTIKLAANNR
jgi:hypothetical protein